MLAACRADSPLAERRITIRGATQWWEREIPVVATTEVLLRQQLHEPIVANPNASSSASTTHEPQCRGIEFCVQSRVVVSRLLSVHWQ